MALFGWKKAETPEPEIAPEEKYTEEVIVPEEPDSEDVIRIAPEDVEILPAEEDAPVDAADGTQETRPAELGQENTAPAEPEVPAMTKEEKKAAKKQLKKITGRLRIRSFGVDLLALAGGAACVLLGLFFGYPLIGAAVGPASAILAACIMFFSHISSAGEIRRGTGDEELKSIYRKKVWIIYVRTIRLMAVLLAAELALPFLMITASREITWQRWAMYGGEFAVLAIILLMILHPVVRSHALRRGILEDTEEERTLRKLSRGSAVLTTILGVIILSAAIVGQVAFRSVPWTAFEAGTTLQDFDSVRMLLEKVTEDTPPENGEYTDARGRSITRDEYCRREIVGPDGEVLYKYRHLNTEIAQVEPAISEQSGEVMFFVAYSVEEQRDGWQKVEAANLLWFAFYMVVILICHMIYRNRVKAKRKKVEERYDAE